MRTEPAEIWPPCVFIIEEMRARGWRVAELAEHMGWPHARASELVRGLLIVDDGTAAALSRAFGSSPEYWLNLQRHFFEALDAALN